MDDAYAREIKDVCSKLGTDVEHGLSAAEVRDRQHQYGPNELPPPDPTPFIKLVIKQFEDLLVLILLGAAVVSFGLALLEDAEDRLTAFVEPAVILLILIANAAVGVIQETNAEKSIEALRKSEARDSQVVRDGKLSVVHASKLVPGDIIRVTVGDKIPADARIVDILTATISVDESLLTGEADPVSKITSVIKQRDVVTAEKKNCLFSGTLVVRGKAVAVVVQTGADTAMGAIASSLNEDDDEKTPLQEKLDEFGEQLSKVILAICITVWLINIGHFTDPDHGGLVKGAIYYFKIAVALAVAAIPEGLPAVVTTCLALGTMKMAKKNAIVRSLPSVETLGCTTVICSDKTGTLTTNKMSVQHVTTVRGVRGTKIELRDFAVEGDSFAPYGDVTDEETKLPLTLPAAQNQSLAEISKISVLCNESDLQYVPADEGNEYQKTGSPTEAALKVLAEKLGVPDEKECDATFSSQTPSERVCAANNYWQELFERKALLEFDRDRKSMSVVVQKDRQVTLLCKGAPEQVLARCNAVYASDGSEHKLTPAIRKAIAGHQEGIAAQGLRVLALAYRSTPPKNLDLKNMDHFADIESDMVFVGLAAMLDPPRAVVPASIAKCETAGIRVIVITGDQKTTAESICKRIGVFDEDEDLQGKSYTGEEFMRLTQTEQDEAVARASLFSRVEPVHKQKLVTLLKKQGEVVAMTGDGVNDAPALKSAHIGIAMGSGTDVAREASDMVLQDDNFATIVMAVEEGRAIYANTKQFIRYLISSNIGEVACIFFTAALGIPEALIPVQLLWVNLVTDGLPATALGFNPPDKDIMQHPPRERDERIINGWMFFRYMFIGIYVGIGTVGGFIHWYTTIGGVSMTQLRSHHLCGTSAGEAIFGEDFNCVKFKDDAAGVRTPSTISLSILVTIEMFNALNALSENQSLLVTPPWSNIWVLLAVVLSFALHFMIVYTPWFADIFHVNPLTWDEWVIVLEWSFPIFLLDEVLKYVSRQFSDDQRKHH